MPGLIASLAFEGKDWLYFRLSPHVSVRCVDAGENTHEVIVVVSIFIALTIAIYDVRTGCTNAFNPNHELDFGGKGCLRFE